MNNTAKLGYYAAWASAVASAGYTVVQLLQVLHIITPPLDDVLIFGFSLCIAPPFLLAMLALHYLAPVSKKFFTHAAVLFAVLYNAFVMLIYVEQLGAVMPYGTTSSAFVVTPHSFFWTVDALGYINMGIAALFAAFAFERLGFEKWPQYFFLLHALITPVVALVYFYPRFSIGLLFAASPWSITSAGAMVCLALYFKRGFAWPKR